MTCLLKTVLHKQSTHDIIWVCESNYISWGRTGQTVPVSRALRGRKCQRRRDTLKPSSCELRFKPPSHRNLPTFRFCYFDFQPRESQERASKAIRQLNWYAILLKTVALEFLILEELISCPLAGKRKPLKGVGWVPPMLWKQTHGGSTKRDIRGNE